ncbi:MAG: hypothetical protein ABH883_02300, partial [Candidatus Omnitrophota bacterium]
AILNIMISLKSKVNMISFKKTIKIIICFCYLIAVFNMPLVLAHNKLAAALLSDTALNPERTEPGRDLVSKHFHPGVIGDGEAVTNLNHGNPPPEIRVMEAGHKYKLLYKIIKASNIALVKYAEKKKEIQYHIFSEIIEQALDKINRFTNSPSRYSYFYNAVLKSSDNYLIGFPLAEKSGLSIELVDYLYGSSPEYLAQYIFRLCIPEQKTRCGEHDPEEIYNKILTLLFGADEVLKFETETGFFINECSRTGQGVKQLDEEYYNLSEKFEVDSEITRMALTADGEIIAVGTLSGKIYIYGYSGEDGKYKMIQSIDNRYGDEIIVPEHLSKVSYGSIEKLNLTPDGKTLISVNGAKKMRIYSRGEGGNYELKHTIYEDQGFYYGRIKMSDDSKKMVCGDSLDNVYLYDLNDAANPVCVKTIKENPGLLSELAISSNGKEFMTAGQDAKVYGYIWEGNNIKPFFRIDLSEGRVYNISYLPGGDILVCRKTREGLYMHFFSGKTDKSDGILQRQDFKEQIFIIDSENVVDIYANKEGEKTQILLLSSGRTVYHFTGDSQGGYSPEKIYRIKPESDGPGLKAYMCNNGSAIICDEINIDRYRGKVKKYTFTGRDNRRSPVDEARGAVRELTDEPNREYNDERIKAYGYKMPEQDDEIQYRAELFKNNLKIMLRDNPGKDLVIAIDSDIGAEKKVNMMDAYKFFTKLEDIIKACPEEDMFSRVKIVRGKGSNGDLTRKIGELGDSIQKENIILVGRRRNILRKKFKELEGVASITGIQDDPKGIDKHMPMYIPILEAVTLGLMAFQNADKQYVKEFYDRISGRYICPGDFDKMWDEKIIYIYPDVKPIPAELLRDIYKRSRGIYLSA